MKFTNTPIKPVHPNVTIEFSAREAYILRCILGNTRCSTMWDNARRSTGFRKDFPFELVEVANLADTFVEGYHKLPETI